MNFFVGTRSTESAKPEKGNDSGVFVDLVTAPGFKPGETSEKRSGGFDSHPLPLLPFRGFPPRSAKRLYLPLLKRVTTNECQGEFRKFPPVAAMFRGRLRGRFTIPVVLTFGINYPIEHFEH